MDNTFTISIETGSTFILPLQWATTATPVNLTGYEARFNLRKSKTDAPSLVSSTLNGLAASTPTQGKLYFTLTAQQTNNIPFSRGYYEVEIFTTQATPYIKKLLKGSAFIDRT